MKKIISFLFSIALISNLFTMNISNAEDKIDIKELADSLGANTDYLNIPNFAYGEDSKRPFPMEAYEEFISKCSNYEASMYDLKEFKSELSAGTCFGLSLIEILSHNGLFSPSDIKPGVKYLNEISYSTDLDRFILGYSATQLFYLNVYYLFSYIPDHDQKAQINELIKAAERNMAQNKYFLICYFGTTSHAIVGIGIADGYWKYNEKEYDKCVLTLDSNCFKDYSYAEPFQEKSCIYINSETMDYYIPKYNYGSFSDNNKPFIVASDDDEILNYRGGINPTKQLTRDFSDTSIFVIHRNIFKNYVYTIKDKDGNIFNASENGKKLVSPTRDLFFLNSRDYHIEIDNKSIMGEAQNDSFEISNMRYDFNAETQKGHGIFDVDDLGYSVSAKNGKDMIYNVNIKYNEGSYPCTPHFNWNFNGLTNINFKAAIADKGMHLSSDSIIETVISTTDVKLNEDGTIADVNDNPNEVKITAVNDVLVSFDDNGKICFFIDPDNDGTFDTAIENGDVNSDGVTDGRDATSVLTDYAKTSSDKNAVSYLNESFADFNDDGVIDGRDATAILTTYAKSSVNNN